MAEQYTCVNKVLFGVAKTNFSPWEKEIKNKLFMVLDITNFQEKMNKKLCLMFKTK